MNAGNQAEKMLEGENYFTCEKLRCRLKKCVCVERQDELERRLADPGKFKSVWQYKHCEDCEQGKGIRRQMTDGRGQKAETGKGRNGEQGAEKEMKQIKTCRVENCGKRAVARGLCASHRSQWSSGNKKMVELFGEFKIKHPKLSAAMKKTRTKPKPIPVVLFSDIEIIEVTVLTLPVGNYPEIIEGLTDAGRVNIRTIEHQALAYIVKGLKADGYGNDNASA